MDKKLIIDKMLTNKIKSHKIIDIHNHVFPDKMAPKAVTSTSEYYGIPMYGKGTVSDMLKSGGKINVNKYVVHSTATKPEQVKDINDYIYSIQKTNDSIIGFGTLHPELEDVEDEIERILSLGIKGVKLHPDFQRFNIDDDSMMTIYSSIGKRLPILIHMGDKKKTFSSPKRLSNILEIFPDLTIIAAHLGGYSLWDKSLEYLVGKDVYFDTSSSLAFLNPKEAIRLIRAHGVEKVLFGTDYPMWSHKEELRRLCSLGFTPHEIDLILWENASKLKTLFTKTEF